MDMYFFDICHMPSALGIHVLEVECLLEVKVKAKIDNP
jgi:hypothetical protein